MRGGTERISVAVRAPDAELVPGSTNVFANQLFMLDEFEVSLKKATQRVRFSVNLAEWLRAITEYVRSARSNFYAEVLTLSGEPFKIRRKGDVYEVSLFDLTSREIVWLRLSEIELRDIHRTLLAEFLSFADLAAGNHVVVTDYERHSLDSRWNPDVA